MNPLTAPELLPVVLPAPEIGSEDGLFEIIDGQRVELPPASAFASRIASLIVRRVGNFAEENDLGVAVTETLFRLALPVARNRRPDVAFVSFERWPKGRDMDDRDNVWNVVPDLAVEVVSPTDLAEEIIEKMDEYFRSSVRQVWIVYPRQRLLHVFNSLTSVRVLTRADELDGGAVLPGMRLAVASLFPESGSA
jgi:Uma2 family endonuclease